MGHRLLLIAFTALVLLGPPLFAIPASAAALRNVTIVLDWIPDQPQHLAYWLAKERGWYAEHGLDVNIQGSRGSNVALQLVVAGRAEFGNVSASALVQGAAKQNVAAKMVAVYFQKDITGIAWFRSTGIRSLKDLEGRTVGIVPGSLQYVLWPVFAKAAGFDPDKVRLINLDPQLLVTEWAAKKFDVFGHFSLGGMDVQRFEAAGDSVQSVAFSDFLPLIGHGIVVRNQLIEREPDVVKGFVEATQKAWVYLVQQPQQAVQEAAEIVHRSVENSQPAAIIEKSALNVIPSRMLSPTTRGRPLGWSAPSDWTKMIDILAESGDYARVPTAAEVMTNRFVGAESATR